ARLDEPCRSQWSALAGRLQRLATGVHDRGLAGPAAGDLHLSFAGAAAQGVSHYHPAQTGAPAESHDRLSLAEPPALRWPVQRHRRDDGLELRLYRLVPGTADARVRRTGARCRNVVRNLLRGF